MDICITPAPLGGREQAVPSKSHAHRLLLCAALCRESTLLHIPAPSVDILVTMDCLRALGCKIDSLPGGDFRLTPPEHFSPSPALFCRESGSTLRFLLPVAAALGVEARFSGEGRLPERPLEPLLTQLMEHGAAFSAPILPFTLSGKLKGGVFTLPGDVSSQYITGLLLAAPLMEEGCEIVLTSPLQSAPYVEMTLSAMAQFGVMVERTSQGFLVPPGQHYQSPGPVTAEGDWSGAAFFLCAGALGGPVTVSGLAPCSSQGDKAVADILRDMGAILSWDGDALTVSRGALRAVTVDSAPIPDLIPVLALTAVFCEGESRFTNAGRLRLKESDRLSAICRMIEDLGGTAFCEGDTLIVRGGILRGGTVHSGGDHRMAMAAAVAACLCRQPVIIRQAQAVDKSYPSFWEEYNKRGGKAHELHLRP